VTARETQPGTVLWEPPADIRSTSVMGQYMTWLEREKGLSFETYDEMWRWSVRELESFWETVWQYFDIISHAPYERVLQGRSMPGSTWFEGAALNYAEHALRRADDGAAVISRSQTRGDVNLTYRQLGAQVARAAAGLRRLGVERGDRVAAYLPNCHEAVVAFLATASIGAIWSSCAPEFGVRSVINRFQQIEPKVLLAVDGYRYGQKMIERAATVTEIREGLRSLTATVVLPYLGDAVNSHEFPDAVAWESLLGNADEELTFTPVPFDHPLWLVYSSGTTGLPKPIVHGHGGVLLEQSKQLGLHHDLTSDDRFFWLTTTGWVMWNTLVAGLLRGAAIVLFDGDPGHPDLLELWRLADDARVTQFGAGAPFFMSCMKAGLAPGRSLDLSHIRAVGSTGSPLPPEGYAWVYDSVGRDLMLASTSGGTDVASGFVGPCPLLPVWSGEMQCRYLGVAVEALDAGGNAVIGERGDLVVTEPLPSMPVRFWGDTDGSRLRESYFEVYPGVWRHGDWVTFTERGSCVISGRSDATLKRAGVRMGTSEFYSVVEAFPEVKDSLVVDVDASDHEAGKLLLFLELTDGRDLDDALRDRVTAALRTGLSPRHVPDEILQVPDVPKTLTNKKVEVPVKRILAGEPPEAVANRDAMVNPGSLDFFVELQRKTAR
jgi:acetoacetyl-CoA synthetase